MYKPSGEEEEKKKEAIFQNMSAKRQQYILKKGYEQWNPFEEPKDPIDIRKDKTKRTSQMLVREFLQNTKMEDYSNEYGRGVLDICLGIINNEDKYRGMYDFSQWYNKLLIKEGYND